LTTDQLTFQFFGGAIVAKQTVSAFCVMLASVDVMSAAIVVLKAGAGSRTYARSALSKFHPGVCFLHHAKTLDCHAPLYPPNTILA
jgi:hypothetical protein